MITFHLLDLIDVSKDWHWAECMHDCHLHTMELG